MENKRSVSVVAALVREGNKFLIGQRPEGKARAGMWEFIGGKTEPNETNEEALIRECREEIGVTVEVGTLFMDVLHDYPDLCPADVDVLAKIKAEFPAGGVN